MNHRMQRVGTTLLLVGALVSSLLGGFGCSMAGPALSASSANKSATTGQVGTGDSAVAPEALAGSPQQADAQRSASAPGQSATPDRLVVSTAAMSIEVKNVDEALTAVRTLAASSNSQVVGLTVQAGGSSGQPTPLSDGSGAQVAGPGSAQITLRVPADKLTAVQSEAVKLGRVLTQNASESDVTQQHVDMAARLKNLQAEEAQLRGFLTKATKVSEMLEIDRELSRVRGDIESMQAQLVYLEQQAAMATLTLSLSSPGSLVEPTGGSWGFSAAVRTGVQAAAGLLRVLIVTVIALSPVALFALLIVVIVRARRRRKMSLASAPETPTVPSDNPEAPVQ